MSNVTPEDIATILNSDDAVGPLIVEPVRLLRGGTTEKQLTSAISNTARLLGFNVYHTRAGG